MLMRRYFAFSATVMHSFVLLSLVLTGIVASPADASDCDIEYGKLVGKQSRFNSKKRQSFIFQNEKRRFNEEFHLRYPSYPGKLFSVRFERISDQGTELSRRLKDIKSASRPNTKQEHEVGELVVRPFVGKTQSARYTSGDLKEISDVAQMMAIEEKQLFSNALAITHITDIHTHPNLGELTGIFFSEADMKSYHHLKEQIESQIDRKIHYRAILLPNCRDCDDVVLIMDF